MNDAICDSRDNFAVDRRAWALLGMALPETVTPVERLVDRLLSVQGPQWFERGLAEMLIPRAQLTRRALLDGSADLPGLKALKDAAKSHRRDSRGVEEMELLGVAGYFVALAAALDAHARLLTARPPGDVTRAFGQLLEALPSDWAGLFERATARLAALCESRGRSGSDEASWGDAEPSE